MWKTVFANNLTNSIRWVTTDVRISKSTAHCVLYKKFSFHISNVETLQHLQMNDKSNMLEFAMYMLQCIGNNSNFLSHISFSDVATLHVFMKSELVEYKKPKLRQCSSCDRFHSSQPKTEYFMQLSVRPNFLLSVEKTITADVSLDMLEKFDFP